MSNAPGAAATDAGTIRRGPRIRLSPWVLVAATALVLLGGVTFLLPTMAASGPEGFAFPGFEVVPTAALTLLGIAVATRQRANPIGWIFLVVGLVFAIQMLAARYARWSVLLADGPDALANIGYWLEAWVWIPAMAMVGTLLFVLFPNGRVQSPRWRWVLVIAVTAATVGSTAVALDPEFGGGESDIYTNPIGVAGASPVLQIAFVAGILALVSTMAAGVLALVVRIRGATGVERRQIQWVLAASALATAALVLMIVSPNKLFEVLVALGVLSIPLAATIAILRYRLWDIDLIINRTLVYLPLTGFLAALYTVAVALFQRVFVAITGETSEAAAVLSALVLAAVFMPVKNRLQAVVDARFKGDPDPTRRLANLAGELTAAYSLVVPGRLARRLADEVRAATGATGVAVEVRSGEHGTSALAGDPVDVPAFALPLDASDGPAGRIAVGPRRSGRPYTESDVAAIRVAAAAAGQALRDAEPAFGAASSVGAGA